jgi:hypothetical protein
MAKSWKELLNEEVIKLSEEGSVEALVDIAEMLNDFLDTIGEIVD